MEFGIDFDEASRCWKENKKSKGNGMYVYQCQGLAKDGKPCRREVMKIMGAEYCKQHINRAKK
jgi:hypothetical protein